MEMTIHAAKRQKQRAIPICAIQILNLYGEEVEQKGGTTVLRLPKRQQKKLRRDLQRLLSMCTEDGFPYLVLDPAGRIITVSHKYTHR